MRIILHVLSAAAGCSLMLAFPAAAQVMVDIPIWSNGILGQQALRNTYDNFNEANGIDDDDEPEAADDAAIPCSADALPADDRRRMEMDYVRRVRSDGKESADAWVREQGMRFHQELVARGICPAPGSPSLGQ